ncbi:T9SS type B sorting domain-containing protein [Maribacter algarum]|uniref:T9SS type B sorting domain-containing protein n=1 Tax=Maribacter algarum (ex Zhang et al. 2020) TaxID=2578118 RepID=A0A5S3PVI1_9FLAO|nr:T9SS type B sorting domain-containing protein [Maribacter algarum]TMM58985.1 T9SS type B sorting domain-containing protein [Maribacter algarum]
MDYQITNIKKALALLFLLMGGFLINTLEAQQNFGPRLENASDPTLKYINIRGDYTFLANSVMNRVDDFDNTNFNVPYNGTLGNNQWIREYVDVDGDNTTFSSSSSTLTTPDCSQIYWAGLYWAGNYDVERYTRSSYPYAYDASLYPDDNTHNEVTTIKFKVPGGTYVDITADNLADPVGDEDEIIIDGYADGVPDSPYVCYKNVTGMLQALADPDGEYFAANIRGTRGGNTYGVAGWTLVVIYENPTLTGKYISVFDGYEGVTTQSTAASRQNIDIAGFNTVPAGPVRARIGVGVLEGETDLTGDRFRIRTPLNNTYSNLSNTANPANNFFNSSITIDGVNVASRDINSTNSMGFDSDIFNINNPANSVIDNGETSARLQLRTSADWFGAFLVTFGVDIIEPDIVLEKKVEDIAGNDITGLGVNLGQTLDYVLSFRNRGNDDATNYTIRDVLPVNVFPPGGPTSDFAPGDIDAPAGVTYTYDIATRSITFSIPDNLVEIGDPVSSIRMRVRVAENCFDFIDACTDLIENLAYSTYEGVINDNVISDDPSVSDFDDCGFVTPGATNFLLDDLENCNFTRTVQLCGDDVLLDAGDNFDSYVWVIDDNGNGLFDATDTVIDDGDPDNDPSTLLVTQEGTYIVDKIIPDPCKGFKEIMVVERFGTSTVNPIIDYFNTVNADADVTNDIEGEITTCSIDGDQLAKIFLCGAGDSQILQTNITDAQTISWELLDESSCTAAPDDCANKNATCTWNQVATGSTYTANSAGKYRLVVTYQNGCFNRFYFDVFQNNLNVEYDTRDIICTTDGYINVTNPGSGYGFQLVDITNNAILVPYSANNGPNFTITSNGQYRVDIVPLDGAGDPIINACVFSTPDIGIRDRDFQVDITTTPANCNAQGSIQVDILNVEADYTYILRQTDGTLIDDETAQPDNTHTFNVNQGDYIIEVATADGCTFSQNVTVGRTIDPSVSALLTQNIGCTAGTITLTAANGLPDPNYSFAIWSYNGVDRYPTISDIPGDQYQVDPVFTFGWRDTDSDGTDEYFSGEDGTYVFVVVDANSCFAFSNPVTISDNGAMTVAITDDSPISCTGSSNAAITIVPTGGVAPFTYSIDGGLTTQTTPSFVGLSAGSYSIEVNDSSGCTIDLTHNISDPFPLSASAGVSRDATCDPLGAEVRITNVVGGTAPYQYSFDGGGTYSSSSIATLPPGTYTIIVRDATNCEFPMVVDVEDTPTPPGVSLTPEVNYNCDGSGTITATPSIPTYNYTYELDGVPNSPDPTSNVFLNVPPGTYTVRTNYVSATPPTPSLLLSEDFGSGLTIPNPNTSGYFYEDQLNDNTPSGAPIDNNRSINDYEYAVTDSIARPFGSWLNPIDHTTGTRATDGRYLVINIGAPAPGQVIYQQPINDIIHNQPLSVSLWLINLMRSGNNRIPPDLTIELRHPGTNALIVSANTGAVPENDIWNEYVLSLNPGANSSLNLVIITNESEISGNDVAIDDITVYQTPEVCPLFVETPVTVVAGQVFESNGIGSTNVSCNGLSDGTITFEVENFDTVAGFDYSVDGGTNWINSTTSPVTTAAIYGAGSQTIQIRKADEITCTTSVTTTITEPTPVVAAATITTPFSCNGGATITASATGGTPTYEYQLEDNAGAVIGTFDFATNGNNTVFPGLAPGDYIVIARDINGCSDPIDTAINIAPTNPVVFSVTPTACYSGANDASIQVDVTNGNGGYQFRINAGPWITPTPANATTYTFDNLANGAYDIEVRDALGCPNPLPTPTNVTIQPELTVSATAPNITACGTSTDIDITAAGGDTNYVYAVVPNGNAVVDGDFSTTNPVAVTTAGDYDVHVRDNNGAAGYCSDMFTITIAQDAPIAITPTPTAVSCFGGSDGAIDIVVDSGGAGPFEFSIDGGTNYQVGGSFVNLSAGTYPVQVRDANGCETTPVNVDVTEPAQLVAEAVQTQDYTCLQLGQITVGSVTPTSGGSGDYQYSIDGGTWTASTTGGHTFVDLLDGTYSIRVRDANAISCETTLADVIIAPLPVEPTLSSAISYNCDGTGDITITPFDPTYTYILDGTLPGQTGAGANVLADVAVGSHIVTVNYGSDCTVDITVVVEPGNAFEASITAFENLDCNADNSGTITISADNFGAGGFEYSLNSGAFVGPFTADEQITGLAAQAHSIVVRDVDDPVAGCTVTLNQTLTEPTPVVAAATITTPFSCNGGATITASATGGTPTYEYQLEDNAGAVIGTFDFATNGNNTVFPGLAPGDYIVIARDINGCSDPIDTAINIAPTNPVVFSVTPTACYSGANDASIQVDVTNGNGGYQFRINAGPWITPTPANATTYTFDNLANGAYDIEVRDALGCPNPLPTPTNVTIQPELTVSATAPNITACGTSTDIDITAAGGDTNYVYAVVPNGNAVVDGDFSTTNPVAVTTAGDYDVHVRDNNGAAGYCSDMFTITIAQDAPIAITPTPTAVSCFGGSDGAIDIVVDSGGAGPFEFSIDGGTNYQVGGSFVNLSAGTYPVQVRDANGCETTPVNVDVTEPAQLVAEAVQTQDYTCLQLGQITVGSVTPTSGGSGDYQYSIDGGTWTASTTGGHTFVDLLDGTYSIRVRDANAISCETTLADVIIAPLPVEPTLSSAISYNCDGTGDITITPFDPTYTYILDGTLPGQTGAGANVLADVAVGSHIVTVNYGSDCTVDITVVVEPGNAFEASITAFENLDCNADNSGTITISADNFGAGGFEYSLNSGAFVGPFTADEQITGLAAQAHSIVVRDVDDPVAGCTVTLNQTLTEPAPIVAAAAITETFTCNTGSATITASATGGTPTYEYQLEDNAGSVIGTFDFATNGNNTIFSGLTAGDYIVRARDINNCSDPIDTPITVVAPVSPTFTVNPTACYSGANDASIVVDVTSVPGNGGFQFSITGNSGPWLTPTPASATSYTFDNLANGTYTIDVRDAFGCLAAQQSITIESQLTAIIDVIDITCNDGTITVTPSGGDGNYAYAFVTTGTGVSAGDFAALNTFTVTAGNDGDYDVYVWDNNAGTPHCEYMETVTVNPATPIAFTAIGIDPECHDGVGSIDITITSGDIPYQIRIVDLDNAGASNQTVTNVIGTTQSFFNLMTGEYEVYVQDVNGCETQLSPNITIDNPDELTATVNPILPAACGSVDPMDYGFQFVGYPTTYPSGTTIEFSADGGATWTGDDSVPGTTDVLMGYISGTSVFPSMRTVVGGVEICRTDLPRYIIPFPLDDLDISISTVVVGCNELQVTVQGTAGVPNYEYTYADDPSTFNIATATWTAAVPGSHTWTGLVPGRTYVFYVRDSTGCIRQSNVNVNDITTNPLEITATYEPSCSGANDAEITYTITDTDATTHPSMRWEFYNANTNALVQTNTGHPAAIPTASTITITGLAPGEYYIVVTEVDASNIDACVSGSENLLIEELNPITASLSKLSDISCNAPGLISVDDIQGGGGTFNFTVTGPAGFTTITATTDNPISIPANSTAGDYNVRVTDQFGCFADFGPINLTLTANPTIDSMVVDNCASPTSLTINATSTAPQILYSIDGGTNYVDNGGVFNNLASGTYNVAIIDSNGCTDTDTVEIFPVLEANVSLTKLIDCTASPDAEITIDVTVGSTSYDYEITNGLGSVVSRTALPTNPFVFTTTVPEDYTITIYDNGTSAPECNRVFTVNVPAAVIPAFTETHADVTCNGSTNGTITLTETLNGINPLTYTISPVAGSFNATTNTFENLPPNTYTVTGTGSNSCIFDIVGIVVNEPNAIANVNATVTEFGCATGNNTENATITIDNAAITGGSNNYVRYEFINDQGTPATGDDVVLQDGSGLTYTETDILGGTYIINVYDDMGCIGTTTATILPYVEITDPTVTVTQDVTCNPGNDAEVIIGIVINPSAGAVDLSYSIVGTDNAYNAPNQASNAFTAIGIGNYLATVTNHLTGCSVQTTFEIEDPNTFEIATTVTDVVCFGDDGSVSFTISDTINPYASGFTWQIYESQGTDNLLDDVIVAGASGVSANLGPTAPFAIGAGEYRVEITQDSDPSCVNNARFVIAGPSAAITANVDVTPITCVGNDGVIEIIDVVGGWGDYSYYVGTTAPTVVGDYVASPRFDALAPGTYQAWVIDQNGCQQEVQNTIVLADPTPIAATLQLNQPNCPNFMGEIEVVGVTGGQGSNYTYQLIKDGTPVGTPQNTTVFSGLDAGSYTVQVNDQWSCTFTTLAEILYEPIVPLATVVKTIDCTVDPGGHINITQTGGSGNFDYEVRYPGTLPADPADDTNTTGVFTTLTIVGDYVFTITDQAVGHACPVTITQNLQDAVLPVLTIDAATNVTCNSADDGTITASVVDNGVGPFVFTIISGPGSSASFPITATSNTDTSAVFEGLEGTAAGITYTVEARGANNCFVTETQIITQPDAIANVNATVTEFGCATGNNTENATITIDNAAITGGSNNYVRYEFINTDTATTVQDGTNSSYTETNFLGGNYSINVYDDNGCIGNTTATIAPFTEISDPTVTVTQDITCDPAILEEIQVGVTLTPAAGTVNLEYTTTGTNVAYNQTNTTGTFTGMGIGNYSISITNLITGCLVQTTHEILDPDVMRAVATKLTDEECLNNGVDEGSLEIGITDYTGNYSYQVYDDNDVAVPGAGFSGTGNTTMPLIITNLPGGVYYVRIIETDAPFCQDDSNLITIIAPEFPVSAIVSEQASPSCSDDQGSILVDPEGGVGPYTIILTNTTTAQTYTETNVEAFIFSGLSGGDFDISITDAQGCPITNNITLVTPDALVATIASTPVICYNANTGTVTASVNPRNVTPNYLFQLNRYDSTGTTMATTSATQASSTFSGLSPGFYSITASDDVGCSDETSVIEIINPSEVVAQLIRTSPLTCATGIELELSATGGSGTYEYSEDNVTWISMTGSSVAIPNANIPGPLGAGTYRYHVRDAINGCISVLSNEISEDDIMPLAFTELNATIIACVGDTAAIMADATGGLGNYMYELYTDVSLSPASRVAGPQSSGTFGNLTSGTYYVNVFSEDCTTPAEQVIIAEPIPLDYTDDVVNALCFGDENGSITVTLSGGAGGYQYSISPNLNQFDDENTFDGLAPGDYTVIAQDQNGCFIQLDYTITAPELLTATGVATPEVCAGDEDGTIALTIQGGTAPYSTRLSDESNFVQDRTDLTGLSAGGYIIFIRDANGCMTDVGITIEAGANLNATVEPIYECTGATPDNYVNITLEDPTVIGDLLYALDSTDPADMQLNPDFRNTAPGSHYITIAHANGCIRTIDFEIEDFEPLTLSLEQTGINTITATADGGLEDYTFYFDGINNGADNTYIISRTDTFVVRVVDANGCEVIANIDMEFIDIEIPNFFTPDGDGLNDVWMPLNQEGFPEILTIIFDRYGREVYRMTLNSPGWDGLYNQSELPTGDYWYVIKLRGENDDREFVGHFTLYR